MLRRWDPFRDLRKMEEMGDHLWRGWPLAGFEGDFEKWAVPLDVVEEDDAVVVRADVPGYKPDEINITVEGDRLVIEGETKEEREERKGDYLMRERRHGKFHRELRLPEVVELEKADTRYADGVLTITFPKIEVKKAKRLEIKAA